MSAAERGYMKHILRYRNILILLVAITISSLAAESPNENETVLDRGTSAEKRSAISRWTSEIGRLQYSTPDGTRKKDWQPGPEWGSILKKVGDLTLDDPQIVSAALNFFDTVHRPVPECVKLCHLVLEANDPTLSRLRSQALYVLSSVGATDDKSVQLIIEELNKQKNPEISLLEKTSSHPLVRTAAIRWLKSEQEGQRELAMNILLRNKLSPDETEIVLNSGISSIEQLSNGGNPNAAVQFIFNVMKNSIAFKGQVSETQLKRLRSLAGKGNSTAKQQVAILLMLCIDKPTPQDFMTVVTALNDDIQKPSGDMLGAVGFWPRIEATATELDNILETAKSRSPIARSGIFSIYLRSGGDRRRVETLIADPKGLDRPDSEYWLAFAGSCFYDCPAPSTWRNLSPNQSWFLFDAMRKLPQAKEAEQAITKIIEDNKSSPVTTLYCLWKIRENPVLKNIPKLHVWLKEISRTVDNFDAVNRDFIRAYSAALLESLFSEKAYFDEVVDKLDKAPEKESKGWTSTTELLLDRRPGCKALDRIRTKVLQNSEIHSPWLAWLIDIRTHKNAGPPPLIALSAALQLESADTWLGAFSSADKLLKPYTGELRNAGLFLSGFGGSSKRKMQFLGLLDRIEIND